MSYPCGTVSQYTSGGCRCNACKAAKKESARAYYEKKRAERVEYSRKYRAENYDKHIESKRKTYQKYRQKNIDYTTEWRKNNPEKAKMYNKVKEHRRRNAPGVKYSAKQLDDRMRYYGYKCYINLDGCTGEGSHADHVKPLSKGGWDMLGNLRPACPNCNFKKNAKWPFMWPGKLAGVW